MVSNPRLRGTVEETTEWEFISLRFSFCLFFTDLFGDVDISLYFCQLIKNVKFHNGQETTDKEGCRLAFMGSSAGNGAGGASALHRREVRS